MFLDVHDRCIKSTDLGGTVEIEKILPFLPGGLASPEHGGLLVGDAWHRTLYTLDDDGLTLVADLSQAVQFCLSDAIVATEHGIYVGDVGFNYLDPLAEPAADGIIVHIERGGRIDLVADKLFFPSGMVITPDKSTLIVAEKLGHVLSAFDVGNDGSLSNRRVWAPLPDNIKPDGICLDGEGAIWVAATSPRAVRVLEGGQIVDEVVAKRPVFAVALGGPQRKHLFLCTSASSDPVLTRRTPSATIDTAMIQIAGVTVADNEVPLTGSISP